jgi:hypothetical protein
MARELNDGCEGFRSGVAAKAVTAAWLGLMLLSAGCANQPCHTYKRPDLANASQQPQSPQQPSQPSVAGKEGAPVTGPQPSEKPSAPPTSTVPSVTAPSTTTPTSTTTVLVFKPDGSLQCQAAKGMSLEEMEKQLAGIKVVSRNKRPDGLMHIQVCGHPTGIINVYEIAAVSLKEAEGRGFKKLDRNL